MATWLLSVFLSASSRYICRDAILLTCKSFKNRTLTTNLSDGIGRCPRWRVTQVPAGKCSPSVLIYSSTKFLIDNNRATSLKTYSRRVNKSFAAPAAKKSSEGDSSNKKDSLEGGRRRVLEVVDENHCHEGSSDFLGRKQQVGNESTFSTISAVSQRRALLEVDPNQLSTSSSETLFQHSQKGNSTAPLTTSSVLQRPALHNLPSKHANKGPRGYFPETAKNSNSHTANSPLPVSDKDIVGDISGPSRSKTRRNDQALASNSSHSATDERHVLKSPTHHLEKPLRKRRQPEGPDSVSPSKSKKVKRSPIKNYFRPLQASSSPSTTRSVKIFSDNLDTPSSPPTSPLSKGESPKYRNSRKTRRNLSIKPSLPPPVTMEYEEEYGMDLTEAFGNIENDSRVERAECAQDPEDRLDMDRSLFVGNVKDYSRIERAESFQESRDRLDMERSLFVSNARVAAWLNPPIREKRISIYVTHETQGNPVLRAGSKGDVDFPTLSQLVPHSDPIDIPRAKKAERKHVTYTQQRFISPQNVNIVCNDCSYMYNRTLEDEVREHSRWHRDHHQGNHSIKGFTSRHLWEENNLDGFRHKIQVNRRAAGIKERDWYEIALEISVRRGLDGPLPTNLWREITDPSAPRSGVQVPRYKVYVYTIGIQVVSVILAERIARAGAFYYGPKTHDGNGKFATPDPDKIQTYVDMNRLFPVMVSVDRLWTEASHRRKGYATKLLDHIRQDFIPGIVLHKCQVAFSVPINDGMAFAKKYCGSAFKDCPFVVNVDDARMVVEDGRLKDRWALSGGLDQRISLISDLGNKDL